MKESNIEEKLNKIKVFNGDRKILVEKFDTTFYTVRRALDGEIHTDLSIKIRETAINDFGGQEIKTDEPQANTNRIKVFDGEKKELKERFFTTYHTVQKALDGETNSLLAYQIREAAIKDFGGKEMLPDVPL